MKETIFYDEKDLLMFYHTALRNILNLMTLSIVLLTFSLNIKNKNYKFFIKILSLLFIIFALYFNISLTNIYLKGYKKNYEYVNYININYLFSIIIFLIMLFISYKLYNIYF